MEISRQLSLDVGIERIITHDAPAPESLPSAGNVLPGDAGIENRLTALLYPRSLTQTLLDALRPAISERAILTPGGYERVLEDALEELKRELDDSRWSKEEREALGRATTLLQEEQSLRELLSVYRHLLHRA